MAKTFSTGGGYAISVDDVDVGAGNLTVTLSVTSGKLTLSGTTNLAFSTGSGAADKTMTFSGTKSAVNTAMDGLSYQPDLNFNGADTLHIDTNDNGNTGAGPVGTDSDTVTINVGAVNDPPVLDLDSSSAGSDSTVTFNEISTHDGTGQQIAPSATIADVDNDNITGATIILSPRPRQRRRGPDR